MTSRWRDHVGITVPELNKIEVEKIEEAIQTDDLTNLKENLPIKIALAIEERVAKEIDEAINFAEKSDFPAESELFDNVYT